MNEIHGMEIWLWDGFPVMAETTRNHTFTKQISHATSRSQYFNENCYCKNCLRLFLAMTGKSAVRSLIAMAKDDKYSFYHDAWLLKAWFLFIPFTYRWCYFSSEINIGRKINFYFPEFQKKLLQTKTFVRTLREDQPLRLLLNFLSYHVNRSEPYYKCQRIQPLDLIAACNQLNVNALN